MPDELKPCPFCGSEPELIPFLGFAGHHYQVRCTNPHCKATISAPDFRETAVATWNRRADEDNPPDDRPNAITLITDTIGRDAVLYRLGLHPDLRLRPRRPRDPQTTPDNPPPSRTTTMAAHTPGPWKMQGMADMIRIVAPGREPYGITDIPTLYPTDKASEQAQADARLIAAAPNLLASLVAYRKLIADNRGDLRDQFETILDQIDADIASARTPRGNQRQ